MSESKEDNGFFARSYLHEKQSHKKQLIKTMLRLVYFDKFV